MADPDFVLRRGPGFNLLAQPAFLSSVISSFFAQNKVEARAPRTPPLDPPLANVQGETAPSSYENSRSRLG